MPGLSVKITDTATPELARVRDGIAPSKVNPVLGRSCVNVLREHFFGLDQTRANSLGGRRTHFYAQAARASTFVLEGNGFFAGTSGVGIRQRYYGGTITPVNAKLLTIPVAAEAYGKRAREFTNLRLAVVAGIGLALVKAAATLLKKGRSKNAEGRKFQSAGEVGGEVMFRLVRSVTQRPDPTVMPNTGAFVEAMERDGGAYLQRLVTRRAS